MTTDAARARAEVQAAVRSVLDNTTLVRGHRSGRTLEQEFRTAIEAALSDTTALDRMLAEARAEERGRIAARDRAAVDPNAEFVRIDPDPQATL